MDLFRRDFLKLTGGTLAGAALPTIGAHAQALPASGESGNFDVRTYGAKGDGHTIDSPAINRAIEAAGAAGGGTVRFPPGTYACYSIHLRSRVALYLEQGATVLAASAAEGGAAATAYDAAEPNQPWEAYQDYGHNHWHNSLIWGEGIRDFAIFGPGLIWGKGLSRGGSELPRAETPGMGNKAIALKNCCNVILRDFSILQGGHFGILATGVDNLTIDNLKIDTNRDGMDIDCCRNVRVSNCSVNSPWDDGICPKSSFALGYARATENVTITNCYVTGAYQLGTMLDGTWKRWPENSGMSSTGRIKFGTESNGGFKNITISNCVFDGCGGFALESVDGALLEDISITNIAMRGCSNTPLFLRLGSRMRGPAAARIGTLKRILINNLVSYDGKAGLGGGIISGIPGYPIEDLKVSGIYLEHRGGGTEAMAALTPPENEGAYPDPEMFGDMPAAGMFVRHVSDIEFTHVEVAWPQPDARPAFWLEDVNGADFFGVKAPKSQSAGVLSLHNVRDLRLSACRNVADAYFPQINDKRL